MRLSLCSAAVALTVALAPPSLAGSEDVQVLLETSRSLYEPGEVVEATVTNKRAGTIYVGGCGAVVAERLDDERYEPVVGEPCVTEGRAVKIEPGAEMKFEIKEAGRSGDVRRLSLAFGWGCNDDRPLSQARCQDFATAVSPSFRVGRRSDDDK